MQIVLGAREGITEGMIREFKFGCEGGRERPRWSEGRVLQVGLILSK